MSSHPIIPGLGQMTAGHFPDWLVSPPTAVPVLGGKQCTLVVESYVGDNRPEDFHRAIANFLSIPPDVLRRAEDDLFAYYRDMADVLGDDEVPQIATPADVWSHVQFGAEPHFIRRPDDDKVYVLLECECDWEPEHGLQLVFKDGLCLTKLGPYDGHLTNSDAYDDESLEGVIYRRYE